ncbi:hypothetical protein Rsub_06009 [Raphidocelis subcapitata]|uniref:Uncharacterized protein n=1 Tax=Raphidocelis subcapitata TaxID=307507 RepID=A0A2V0P7X1_9CHLO|nr:hypothetical protein Rsub_06009 [Raphidocelis subcapitata]|eukprot:GBF93277.1 hypothetical protein Rsub_06009 [Raphidocelis subcapitata]
MVSTRGSRASTRAEPPEEPATKPPRARATARRASTAAAPAPALSPPASPQARAPAKRTRGKAGTSAAAATIDEDVTPIKHKADTIRLDQAVADAAATPLPPDGDDASPALPSKRARTSLSSPTTPATGGKAVAGGRVKAAARSKAGAAARGDGSGPRRGGLPGLLLLLLTASATGGGGYLYLQRHPEAGELLQQRASAAAARARLELYTTTTALGERADALRARGRDAAARAAGAAAAIQAAAADKFDAHVAPRVGGLLERARSLTGAGAGSAPAAAAPAWDAGEIAALLPAGAAWEELAADIAERLGGAAAGTGRKGVGLLLGCAHPSDCAAAAEALASLSGVPEGCALRLDGGALAEEGGGAGALQSALASFLRRCPAGLTVVGNADQLPLESLPALQSALSELGGFQHGGSVDASRGVYALLLPLPDAGDARAAAGGEPSEAQAWLKRLYFEGILGAEAASESDLARAENVLKPMLRALQRRIDFAAPLRLGADAEAAAAAGEGEGGEDWADAASDEVDEQ